MPRYRRMRTACGRKTIVTTSNYRARAGNVWTQHSAQLNQPTDGTNHEVKEVKAKEECVDVCGEEREVDHNSTGELHHMRHQRVEQEQTHSKPQEQQTYVCVEECVGWVDVCACGGVDVWEGWGG